MDFTWLGRGATMGGPERAYAHPLGSQAHPLESQAQPIRMSFSPQKGFITDIITPQFHQLSGLRRSRKWRRQMWRSRAGMVTRGLRLRPVGLMTNSPKRQWRWFMVEKWTFNSLATALVDIPAFSMPTAHSVNLRHKHFATPAITSAEHV